MRIGVIGSNGYVGEAMVSLLREHYNVVEKDIQDQYMILEGCELVVICVPTAEKADGSCDTSIVEEAVAESVLHTGNTRFLCKSTVPPGTCEQLQEKYGVHVVFSPEYIGEGKYMIPWWEGMPHPTDIRYHNFMIFGGSKEATAFCVSVFAQVIGPHCQYFQTDSTTAELVKYMENAFYATKVTFCNEYAKIVESFGREYAEVREMWLADQRVNKNHTVVFRDSPGFAGKCLPKDVNAIIHAVEGRGYKPTLLREVVDTNKTIRGGK